MTDTSHEAADREASMVRECQALDNAHSERDEALATIGRLDEDVAMWISRAVDAEATIERVKVLVAPWITIKDVEETHSAKCHAWHPDCLVSAIRAALVEEKPGDQS